MHHIIPTTLYVQYDKSSTPQGYCFYALTTFYIYLLAKLYIGFVS